jgi:hypothetical protein
MCLSRQVHGLSAGMFNFWRFSKIRTWCSVKRMGEFDFGWYSLGITTLGRPIAKEIKCCTLTLETRVQCHSISFEIRGG